MEEIKKRTRNAARFVCAPTISRNRYVYEGHVIKPAGDKGK